MRLAVNTVLSLPGSTHNEDRVGVEGAWAWIIDGATDLLETPLLPAPSDAAWLADALDSALARHAKTHSGATVEANLDAMLETVTAEVAARFDRAALRRPVRGHEKPSAAGVVACFSDGRLDALSLGDCTFARFDGNNQLVDLFRAEGPRDADDDVREDIAALQAEELEFADSQMKANSGIRGELLPGLRIGRDSMNTPNGYGIFSLDVPPPQFVTKVSAPAAPGDRFLFATDGFMRLVDIFGIYPWNDFGPALVDKGLARLAIELRDIEADDATGRHHPRVKSCDDATAMIVEVV